MLQGTGAGQMLSLRPRLVGGVEAGGWYRRWQTGSAGVRYRITVLAVVGTVRNTSR